MSKRWTLEDDKFLAEYHEIGPDFIASHDLGHHGKNAGTKRIEKLKQLGVWEKLIAHRDARIELQISWSLAFGPNWAREIAEAEASDRAVALMDKAVVAAEGVRA